MKLLSYLVKPSGRTEEEVETAVDAIEGVDYIVGQGTGLDSGPYYLGAGETYPFYRRQVEPILREADRTDTPFIFSLGTPAGADVHLARHLAFFDEVAADNGLGFELCEISGEVDPDYLLGRLAEGAEVPRAIPTPELSETLAPEEVERAVRVQAQMGPEPIVDAIERYGDDIDGVVTGRSLDIGLYMAPLLHAGVDRATAAHVGKIIECGGMCTENHKINEGVVATVHDDGSFTVRSANPRNPCTVESVSTHSIYERENPFEERNPGGVLDLGEATYEEVDDGEVRVAGAEWRETPYTVKLEGVRSIGYQSMFLCGIRDPAIVARIDEVVEWVEDELAETTDETGFDATFNVYGKDAVLGDSEPEPDAEDVREVAVTVVVTSDSQETSNKLTKTASSNLLQGNFPRKIDDHFGVGTARPGASRLSWGAIPFQKKVVPLGEAYKFSIWHLLPLDDPAEPFRSERTRIGV